MLQYWKLNYCTRNLLHVETSTKNQEQPRLRQDFKMLKKTSPKGFRFSVEIFALPPGAAATAACVGHCPQPSWGRCPGTPQASLVLWQRSCRAARVPVAYWRTESNCPFPAAEPTFTLSPGDPTPRDKYTQELRCSCDAQVVSRLSKQ